MFRRGYNGMCNYFGGGAGFMYSGWGMIMLAVFIVLATITVIYLVKRTGRHQSSNDAIEELKMRFAKGEITEEEYFSKKNILD